MTPGASDRRDALILVAATAALLLPFVAKPPNVDDPLFLLAAQRIREAPFDPYGVDVNWYGGVQPLHVVAQNPPGAAYLLALFGLLGGTIGMHVGMIGVAAAAVLGVRALAKDLGAAPLFAGLLALATPVFLVSATTLMCDVTMTALATWSVVLWLRGLRGGRGRLLFAGAALAVLAALTKYYAVTLVPLFGAAALLHRRPLKLWGPPLLVVVAALAAYEMATKARWGTGHLTGAVVYATGYSKPLPVLDMVIGGFVFAGGCVVSVVACAPLVLPRRAAVVCGAATVVVAGLLLRRDAVGVAALTNSSGLRWTLFVHAVVFLAAATVLLAVVVGAVARGDGGRRNPDAVVLALWICGTLVFALFLNWTTNGRSLLPVVPPLAVLVARRMSGGTAARAAALVPGIVVSLLVAWGDARLAAAQVEAADTIRTIAGARTTWFQGHWGFQTAMQAIGARQLEFDTSPVAEGDLVVVPYNNTNLRPFVGGTVEEFKTFEIPLRAPATTTDVGSGAGFYSSIWGPLPFTVGVSPPERYTAFVAVRAFDVAPRRR